MKRLRYCLVNYIGVFLCTFNSLTFLPRLNAQDTKFNKSYTIACHNCFETSYASNIEEALKYTTAIELDIWDNEIGSGIIGAFAGRKMNNDWYIKHSPTDRGNVNNCGCSLKGYLDKLKQWSINNPNHQPLTIFLDKKENWSGSSEARKPVDLDNLILSVFDKEKIYYPSKLKGTNNSLREAVSKNVWDSIDSLKNKLIFIITDATVFTQRNNALNKYLDARSNDALCFVAPIIQSDSEILSTSGISSTNQSSIVIYNLEHSHSQLATRINSLNFLSRVFNAPETQESVTSLLNNKVNFVAMLKYMNYNK